MRYVIDRIEEHYAVCENEDTGEMEDIDIFLLPDGIKEGDILLYDEDLDMYYLDEEEKRLREERIKDKMQDIWLEDNDFTEE